MQELKVASAKSAKKASPGGSKGSSQLADMTACLDAVPKGGASRGRLTKIRLVHKKSFLRHPFIAAWLQVLEKAVRGLVITTEIRKMQMIGYCHSVSSNVTDRAVRDQLAATTDTALCQYVCTELERIMLWTDEQDDSMFRMFDLAKCPKFTFVSHRWGLGARPLGMHNELPLLLSKSPQEYFWLDCSCAPQDAANRERGNT